MRKRRLRIGDAPACPDVEVIECAGANTDEYFVSSDLRLGDVFDLQNVDTAEAVDLGSFHADEGSMRATQVRPPFKERKLALATELENENQSGRGQQHCADFGNSRGRFWIWITAATQRLDCAEPEIVDRHILISGRQDR